MAGTSTERSRKCRARQKRRDEALRAAGFVRVSGWISLDAKPGFDVAVEMAADAVEQIKGGVQ